MANQNTDNRNQANDSNRANIFVRCGRKIGAGFRAVRESPAAAAIGAVFGAAVTGGSVLLVKALRKPVCDEDEPVYTEEVFEEEPEEEEEVIEE